MLNLYCNLDKGTMNGTIYPSSNTDISIAIGTMDKPSSHTKHRHWPMSPNQQKQHPNKVNSRENWPSKLAHLIGALLLLLFVALPKDLLRWFRLRRKSVSGQTVVITGAGSGIGKRLAELFADPGTLGARVAIVDMNLEAAEQVAQGIARKGGQARAWKCDIVNAEEMRQCAQEIKKHFGSVDIVICNAAILYFAHTLQLQDHEIQRALDVNILGTINTIRAFLPEFEAQGRGQIVAISSIAGWFGETFGMAYCPSKFAVRGIMECLRMELRDRGLEDIACTTICPYFVRTPMILNKGLRPISRWIPFMSIERCATLIVDSMLKEKVIAFVPPWLSLLTTLNCLFSLNMQRIARDFINCRFEEPPSTATDNGSNTNDQMLLPDINSNGHCIEEGKSTKGMIIGNADENSANEKTKIPSPLPVDCQRHRQMRDHFEFAHPAFWVLIPPAMLLTFITFYSPELLNMPWLGFFGQFLYKLGTEHPQLLFWLNVFAWSAHFSEAIFALYLADKLRLSHKSAFQWFLQTTMLGFPSLGLLVKRWRKER